MTKIGFACKYVHPDRDIDAKTIREIEASHNQTTTTAKWMRDNPDKAEERVWTMVQHNITALKNMVNLVGKQPEPLRMFRIGSGVLPMYTHVDCNKHYQDKTLQRFIETRLRDIGTTARKHGIKLSFHPGQFCVLASDDDQIIQNSIDEFEYHADIARMMGYGKTKLDFKCNVHLSGRGGISQFRKTFKKLSPVARNIITLENDEYTSCLDDLLEVRDLVGVVLDVHHYWIHQEQHILKDDPRLDLIQESWGDVRPTIHYSYSRHDYMYNIQGRKPDIQRLIEAGFGKNKLRAHSDFYPNAVMNNYVLEFAQGRFDIMCEAKAKNLASIQLYEQAVRTNLIN